MLTLRYVETIIKQERQNMWVYFICTEQLQFNWRKKNAYATSSYDH